MGFFDGVMFATVANWAGKFTVLLLCVILILSLTGAVVAGMEMTKTEEHKNYISSEEYINDMKELAELAKKTKMDKTELNNLLADYKKEKSAELKNAYYMALDIKNKIMEKDKSSKYMALTVISAIAGGLSSVCLLGYMKKK